MELGTRLLELRTRNSELGTQCFVILNEAEGGVKPQDVPPPPAGGRRSRGKDLASGVSA